MYQTRPPMLAQLVAPLVPPQLVGLAAHVRAPVPIDEATDMSRVLEDAIEEHEDAEAADRAYLEDLDARLDFLLLRGVMRGRRRAVAFEVAPRYTGGSPAPVGETVALSVARDELAAYRHALEGLEGDRLRDRARVLGVEGIVVLRVEATGKSKTRFAWLAFDFLSKRVVAVPGRDRLRRAGFYEGPELAREFPRGGEAFPVSCNAADFRGRFFRPNPHGFEEYAPELVREAWEGFESNEGGS